MAQHGMTVRYCYKCGKQTSHAIVEAPKKNITAYMCLDIDHNLDERDRQAKEQGNESQ